MTDASGSGRKTQRPQVHASAEHIQDVFQTCAPGPGIIGGGAPGNPSTTQSRGWERTNKGACEECPRLGVPSEAYFARTTTRGSLGTFHPWKVPRPGAKYPPSFSGSRDHGTGKRQTCSHRPYGPTFPGPPHGAASTKARAKELPLPCPLSQKRAGITSGP